MPLSTRLPISLSLAAALGASVLAAPAKAQPQSTQVGTLACDVSAGIGLIITSQRNLVCRFDRANGTSELYAGTIRRFGLDLGATAGGVLVWSVFAPTVGIAAGALAGEYAGASAEATVGAGLGANVLVGGTGRSVALQPVSVQGQAGLNVAVGVADLILVPAR